MKYCSNAIAIAASLLVASWSFSASAQPKPDGYCDYVKGVAAAESALLYSPELFSNFGYVDQISAIDSPGTSADELRFTVGVSYGLGNLYRSRLIRKRADAECRRHRALASLGGETEHRALAARSQVLQEALTEAEEMLSKAVDDLDRRRITRQELIATRLRVEDLRQRAADTRRQLQELPAPTDDSIMARSLQKFYSADNEVERQEGKLRRARAWDVSVRLGYDTFLDNDDSSPYFALVSASFNVGWFLQGSANRRAANGRDRIVRSEIGVAGVDATENRLRSLLVIDSKRAEEAGVLVRELEEQLKALRRLGGDTSRRLAETVWFELVKARAEHEYLTTHVNSLKAILGQEAP